MQRNLYKYIGPLDPIEDEQVCMPRLNEKNKVVSGILNGDYWTILGPRQIGKTTFLRQLMHELKSFHCIYFNFEVSPKEDEKFYKWIIERTIEAIEPTPEAHPTEKWKSYGPELYFLNFLEKLQTEDKKKIIFFFDEMEKAHCVRSFLHLWRKVFHERYHRPELKRYGVIIAGKVDLSSLTIGPTSPFNIAKKLELSNLSNEESRKLLLDPFELNRITIENTVAEKLLSVFNGHPQLLQHICSILTEQAVETHSSITPEEIENAMKRLFIESDNLKTLENEIKTNKILENLSKQILEGKDKPFTPYRDLSITGTGPIVPRGNYCSIRNTIYEKVLSNLISESASANYQTDYHSILKPLSPTDMNNSITLEKESPETRFITSIFFKKCPSVIQFGEEKKEFLKALFDISSMQIQIKKDDLLLPAVSFNRTERLVFCYLAFQNFKAINAGDTSSMHRYHMSSVPVNNIKQEPEWNIFADAVNIEGKLTRNSAQPDVTLRAAIFSLRKKLKFIGAEALIPRQKPGSGEGYWLAGIVSFLPPEN